ncbi:MAG: hypothetical protein ABI142_06225 [Bryocella sp.]
MVRFEGGVVAGWWSFCWIEGDAGSFAALRNERKKGKSSGRSNDKGKGKGNGNDNGNDKGEKQIPYGDDRKKSNGNDESRSFAALRMTDQVGETVRVKINLWCG